MTPPHAPFRPAPALASVLAALACVAASAASAQTLPRGPAAATDPLVRPQTGVATVPLPGAPTPAQAAPGAVEAADPADPTATDPQADPRQGPVNDTGPRPDPLTAPLQRRWTIEPAVRTQLTYTTNSAITAQSNGDADTILEVVPSLLLIGRTPRLRVDGDLQLQAVRYLGSTQPSKSLPNGSVDATLEAYERLFYVDAEIRAERTAYEVFGVRTDTGTNTNSFTTWRYALSPYFQGRFGPRTRWELRHEWRLTTGENTVTTTPDERLYRTSGRVEVVPAPLGGKLLASRSTSRYPDSLIPATGVDQLRATLYVAVNDTLYLGPRFGAERNDFVGSPQTERFGGLEAEWRPTPRSELLAAADNRYFGTAWNVSATHRRPDFAILATSTRDLVLSSERLYALGTQGSVSSQIDATLTTRVPDAAARAALVNELLRSLGLPGELAQPYSVYTPRMVLVRNFALTATLLGRRNALTLTVFRAMTEPAPLRTSAGLASVFSATDNNLQRTAAVSFSRRLRSDASANLSASRSLVTGLDPATGINTAQTTFSAELLHQLSQRTAVLAGLRWTNFHTSTVASTLTERALYLALSHRL